MEPSPPRKNLSPWDVVYAAAMAVACLIAYWLMAAGLARLVDAPTDYLGGMWAAIAAVFVFRETRPASLLAGTARLLATCVSFALCLPYLLICPSTPVGMAALLAVGSVIMMVLGRRDDIITTAITTVVVMVVAAISPQDAWQQPLLRLADTVVGIAVGVSCEWIGAFLFHSLTGKPAR